MSILGIGIDLCEIARIESSLEKYGDKFASKILHENELKLFMQQKFKARFLAKRFAAKEAFAKAMGTGIAEGLTLPCIEVYNNELGKPLLRFHGLSKKRLEAKDNVTVHLSITDERQHAIAQVIIESN